MKNKNQEALKRVQDGENVLEGDGGGVEGQKTEDPRDPQDGQDHRAGADPSADLLDEFLVLYRFGVHHLAENEHEDDNIHLRNQQEEE